MEQENNDLKKLLAQREEEIANLKRQLTERDQKSGIPAVHSCHDEKQVPVFDPPTTLNNQSIARYSRQLILPEIGVKGQIAVGRTSMLIVGAGGLGCPSSTYLAAAGVGRIGLVDFDEVELSNLHRQISHAECRVGVPKAASCSYAVNQLNSQVQCVPYRVSLDSSNALDIIKHYDIILDCTDNVATRYLLNDACILAGKPLVSGSALRFEGQLTVYNYDGGPCYRCLYPKPPPPETVTNCSDGGVLGVVPGIIGCMQALEAIKIASGIGSSFSQRLLMFDALDGMFRTIKLRGRQVNCVVCGDQPTITQLIDYEQFCGARATDKDKELSLVQSSDRVSVQELQSLRQEQRRHLLIDVRLPVEMDICRLPDSINIPLRQLSKPQAMERLSAEIQQAKTGDAPTPVFAVCRRGNDSQQAVHILRKVLKDENVTVQDIRGGLAAWAKHIDTDFPVY